jgi:hypothetical protein
MIRICGTPHGHSPSLEAIFFGKKQKLGNSRFSCVVFFRNCYELFYSGPNIATLSWLRLLWYTNFQRVYDIQDTCINIGLLYRASYSDYALRSNLGQHPREFLPANFLAQICANDRQHSTLANSANSMRFQRVNVDIC